MKQKRYTQVDLDTVSDNPELTAEDLAQLRPFEEVFPHLAESIRRSRGKQRAPTKVSTTIRLSHDVVEHFRKHGSGWQARIDTVLKEWIAGHP